MTLIELIQLYTNMKPTDWRARIMDDLDIETTIMILGTMKAKNCRAILCENSSSAAARRRCPRYS